MKPKPSRAIQKAIIIGGKALHGRKTLNQQKHRTKILALCHRILQQTELTQSAPEREKNILKLPKTMLNKGGS
jgi:hypothetical protein